MPFHHCAAVVLNWGGQDGGCEPGSFVRHLLDAFGAADPENFALLASVYPTLGMAMALYQRHPDGPGILRVAVLRQSEDVPEDNEELRQHVAHFRPNPAKRGS